ncbi:MAG: DUF3955 domain-containing protein [Aquiluna sp.]
MGQNRNLAEVIIKAVNLLGTLALVLGVSLGIYYVASGGSTVDDSGLLVEEFWALALSWFFVLSSVALAAIGLLMRLVRNKRS